MYIGKLKLQQIDELLKTMMLQEAKSVEYYQNNLSAILDGSLFKFKVVKSKNNEYVVSKIKNGDLFVFDDCNYIKFEMPSLHPVSLQKNTNVYNNFMRNKFSDFSDFEIKYNNQGENIVNIVNFCEDLLKEYKQDLHKNMTTWQSNSQDYKYSSNFLQSNQTDVEY